MPGPCHRCGRQVFSAEERLALSGCSWHQECFTCAVCNKSLDSTNLAENHENREIYCKNCYRILYGTKGYGYGPNEPTLVANTGPLEDCYEVTPTNSKADLHQFPGKNTAVVVKPFEQIPFRKSFLYWGRHPTPRHYGHQVVPPPPRILKKCDPEDEASAWPIVRSRSSSQFFPVPQSAPPYCRPPPPPPAQCRPLPPQQPYSRPPPPPPAQCRPLPPQSSQCRSVPPAPQQCRPLSVPPTQNCRVLSRQVIPKSHIRRSTHGSSSSHSKNGEELCQRCGRPVYFAERRYGYHGVYHARCYVCCSCGKSLETTTVNEDNGTLYCTGCYKRIVAADGVGFGLGAGTLRTH